MAGATEHNVKKSEDNQSPKELIKDFCGYTTTHGIGRLAEARTLFSRFIWTIFILGAFTMFIFQTHGLFTLWLSRPVATVVKVKHNAVSISWYYYSIPFNWRNLFWLFPFCLVCLFVCSVRYFTLIFYTMVCLKKIIKLINRLVWLLH